MTAPIILTGLSTNDPVPGNYLEILFAQGESAGFAGQRPILLMGNKLSTGTAVVDTTVYGPDTATPARTESDVILLTGEGSEVHRMWRRAQKVARQDVSIYFICVAESAGDAASLTFTLTGVPSEDGFVRIWIGDEFCDTSFAASDSISDTVTAVVASINAKSSWAVTAAASSPDIVVTAKQKGPRGNWLRGSGSVSFGNGGVPDMTITNTTDTYFAGGATADSNTNALGAIQGTRYYYIASAAEDSSQFGALVDQVNSQALPTSGIRQRAFAGSIDTESAAASIATGLNATRAEVIWQEKSDWTPAELAAASAALYAVKENSGAKPLCNFNNFPRNDSEAALWRVPAPRDRSVWPTRLVIKAALLAGLTPIGVSANQKTYLVKRVTTRTLNGSLPDYRIRDSHKVTICDFFGDDLIQKENDQLGGKNLSDDVKQGQPPPPKDTTTPARYRELIVALLNSYSIAGGSGLLQDVDQTKADMIVQREPGNPSRMSASIPLTPVDILDSTAALISQVG